MRYLVLFFVFVIFQCALAADFFPSYVNSGLHYGTGVLAIEKEVKIYENADVNSFIVAAINQNGIAQNSSENAFIISNTKEGVHFITVEDDNDEWYYVCYNQDKKLFGWVKKNDEIDYISWEQLFNLYGRKNGVYIFKNIPDKYKKLYSAPNIQSTVVDSFTFPKNIAPWLISDNWMLVKVTTYDGITKTGWMQYKLENGNMIALPDFRAYHY